MAENSDTSIAPASSSAEAAPPAPAADDQKPGATPASVADDQKPEPAADTPEQAAAKAESRRARSNARKAQALAEARAEAKLLREELERTRASSAPKPGSDEPKRADFEDYDSYTRALARWEAKEVTRKELDADRKASQGREQQTKDAQGQAEIARKWTERETEVRKANKDYDKIVNPFVEEDLQDLHQAARTAIVESEHGPALLLHLATDTTGIMDRLAPLSPTRQIAELGKLETQLQKSVKPSNAPPPTTPIAQGRAGQSDPNKMTDAEYKAFRKSQGARWAQ